MSKVKKILILPLLLLAMGARAQSLTLAQCLEQGLEANYGIRIARGEQQIAAHNVTYAPFLPTLTAAAAGQTSATDQRLVYRDAPRERSDYRTGALGADLVLGWRLFDGLAMFAEHETARELLREGELNLLRSMEELAVDIASQYYHIVTQQGRLEAAHTYLEISTLRYNQALEKYNIGAISGLEMRQARLDFNADSSNFVLQQQVIVNARIQLFELMNLPLSSGASLTDTIVPDPALELQDLRLSAMQVNTAIRLAENGRRISTLDLRIARASRYPTLDLSAAWRYDQTTRSNAAWRYDRTSGPSAGLTLSVPLFNGMETRRRIRNARVEQQISQLEVDRTRAQVESALWQHYNVYRKNIAMISFEEESAQAARLNMQAAMEMYRLGTMSGVEFREIQRSYLEAIERKLDALYEAKISEIGLLYLAGLIL